MIGKTLREKWSTRSREVFRALREELGVSTGLDYSLEALEEVINSISKNLTRSQWRGDELYALCPFHDDRHVGSFSVNRMGHFYCFVCGASGGIHKLMHRLGVRDREIHDLLREVDFDLLAGSLYGDAESVEKMPTLPEGILAGFDLLPRKLLEKGHPAALLERLDIRLDLGNLRIVYPVRRATGELVAIQSRTVSEDPTEIRWKFYRKEIAELLDNETLALYGLEHYEPPRKTVFFNEHNVFLAACSGRITQPIVLTEGPGHCLRSIACGYPSLASFGTQLGYGQRTRLLDTLLGSLQATGDHARVIVATDGDAAGRRSAVQIAMSLAHHCDLRIADIPEGHDPEDLSVRELRGLLSSAPRYIDLLREKSPRGKEVLSLLEEEFDKIAEEKRRTARRERWIQRQKEKERSSSTQKKVSTAPEARARHALPDVGNPPAPDVGKRRNR